MCLHAQGGLVTWDDLAIETVCDMQVRRCASSMLDLCRHSSLPTAAILPPPMPVGQTEIDWQVYGAGLAVIRRVRSCHTRDSVFHAHSSLISVIPCRLPNLDIVIIPRCYPIQSALLAARDELIFLPSFLVRGLRGHMWLPTATRKLERRQLSLACSGRKEGRFTHPWQPARLIGWNSVWVGQCDISAMTSCQGRL